MPSRSDGSTYLCSSSGLCPQHHGQDGQGTPDAQRHKLKQSCDVSNSPMFLHRLQTRGRTTKLHHIGAPTCFILRRILCHLQLQFPAASFQHAYFPHSTWPVGKKKILPIPMLCSCEHLVDLSGPSGFLSAKKIFSILCCFDHLVDVSGRSFCSSFFFHLGARLSEGRVETVPQLASTPDAFFGLADHSQQIGSFHDPRCEGREDERVGDQGRVAGAVARDA